MYYEAIRPAEKGTKSMMYRIARAGTRFRRILNGSELDEALRYSQVHSWNDKVLDVRKMQGDQYRVTLRRPTRSERLANGR